MFLFVVRNSYEDIQTMHVNEHCLNVVCEYIDYEEK